MIDRFFRACAESFFLALLLAGCTQGNSGDNAPAPVTPSTGVPIAFLAFPNPQLQPDGSLQTLDAQYAQSYYAAIDPTNAKDTLAKWRAANGFDTGTGTQVTAVFGDVRDLGYGRRMTVRQNPDGTIAAFVENYVVTAIAEYGSYSSLSLDAAVVRDQRWHVGTNAIEFSPGPGGGVSFAKFFTFHPVTGDRQLMANMDGRGQKAVPSVCISCHGGRADPLTPPDGTGQPLFPLVQNSVSLQRGNTQAQLMPFEVDTFDFSTTAGFRRVDQEAALKAINQMVLCTYPRPAPSAFPEDACRRAASSNEWQGGIAQIIKNAYGGNGLPNATYAEAYLPAGWSAAGQTPLYQNVVAQTCRACHLARGTGNQSDIDFDSFAKFQGSADRIKAHVIDRGNMPLAKIVFDRFWSTNMADSVATFLVAQGFTARDGTGTVLRPGRPVADPGPNRVIKQGATALSAAASLFANTHTWSILSGPNGATPPTNATLTNANSALPTFNATADGTYVLQLVASNGATASTPVQLTLVVNSALALAPSAIRFSDIKARLQSGATFCTGCHLPGGVPLPPIFFTNTDRNGDGIAGNATDDLWFYTEVRGRINFTNIVASPLLRKPSGNHHAGGLLPGFDTSAAPGAAARADYDLFLNWALNGAPQ